jgi:prophage tail gpP-like protein
MSELTLTVSGLKYEGWQNISVNRSIEQVASSFSVGFAELWYKDGKAIPIDEGEDVDVKLDGELVITGYVDTSNITYDAQTHSAQITGRSKTGDLVDCLALVTGGLWKTKTIDKIATDICQPFNINASVSGSPGAPFRRFSLQDGETAFDAIERAARMRGMLVIDDTAGDLVLTRAGSRSVSTKLELGVNILRANRRGSASERFSQYICKVQIPGDDNTSGKQLFIKRTADDSRVNRYRPTQIMAETEDTGKEVKDRVTWERNRRAADARRVTYTVQGWTDDSGQLWEPNTLVTVKDEFLRIDGELLVVSVAYNKSLAGTTTDIELTNKEAFDLIDLPPPKPPKKSGKDFFG